MKISEAGGYIISQNQLYCHCKTSLTGDLYIWCIKLLVLPLLKNKFNLIIIKKKLITGNTLNEISHHPAEMGSDVFQHVQLLLVLSF